MNCFLNMTQSSVFVEFKTLWDESKLPTLSFDLEFRSIHFYRFKSIYIDVRIMKIMCENKITE